VDEVEGTEERGRSFGLVAMLVLYALGAVAAGALLVRDWADRADHGEEITVVLVLSMVSVLLQLASVVALFAWRKWGLYLIGVLAAAGLIMDIASQSPAVFVAAKIVLAGLLAFAVMPYWDRMID
jgi:hypothetical protein